MGGLALLPVQEVKSNRQWRALRCQVVHLRLRDRHVVHTSAAAVAAAALRLIIESITGALFTLHQT